jgi:hypothetical protein
MQTTLYNKVPLCSRRDSEQLSLLRPNWTRFGQSKTDLPPEACVRWRCFWFPATMAVQLGEHFVILAYFFHIIRAHRSL